MPNYPLLETNTVDGTGIAKRMSAMQTLGVPYIDADISAAATEVDGKTEMQAVVAYLQVLGTMVKFDEEKDYRE